MFDSGVSLESIILDIKAEADIIPEVPDSYFLQWANALEQFLYTEFIKEQRKTSANLSDGKIALSEISVPAGEEPIRFEEIHAIYHDGIQLKKTTITSGMFFDNVFYHDNGFLCTKPNFESVIVIYLAKPKIKTSIDSGNVMLPYEFLELMKSKLRGEAYKYANEDELAAKWLSDYNVLLETFKAWISTKEPSFGI